jgi:hypothetical protein
MINFKDGEEDPDKVHEAALLNLINEITTQSLTKTQIMNLINQNKVAHEQYFKEIFGWHNYPIARGVLASESKNTTNRLNHGQATNAPHITEDQIKNYFNAEKPIILKSISHYIIQMKTYFMMKLNVGR